MIEFREFESSELEQFYTLPINSNFEKLNNNSMSLQVKVWFQNRRIKWRKHHLEVTQQRLAIIRQHQLPMPANPLNAENHINRNENNPTTSNLLASSPASMDFENTSTGRDTSAAIDSELSICSDSMDSNSKHDVEDL